VESSNLVRLSDAVAAPMEELASFVSPTAWGPARDVARELSELRERLASILQKVEDVKQAQWQKGARRVQDVDAMAETLLKGQIPAEAPVATPEVTCPLSLDGA
jgi:hypothetical protein